MGKQLKVCGRCRTLARLVRNHEGNTGQMRLKSSIDRFRFVRLLGRGLAPILFFALVGCMPKSDTALPGRGNRVAHHPAVLAGSLRRLTRKVLVQQERGANPSALSRPFFWRVDGRGRIDLVTWVRPGRLERTIRWIVQEHGRILAKIRALHEFEAWVPARIVFALARKPGVRMIRFPHYAKVHN